MMELLFFGEAGFLEAIPETPKSRDDPISHEEYQDLVRGHAEVIRANPPEDDASFWRVAKLFDCKCMRIRRFSNFEGGMYYHFSYFSRKLQEWVPIFDYEGLLQFS